MGFACWNCDHFSSCLASLENDGFHKRYHIALHLGTGNLVGSLFQTMSKFALDVAKINVITSASPGSVIQLFTTKIQD